MQSWSTPSNAGFQTYSARITFWIEEASIFHDSSHFFVGGVARAASKKA